MDLWLLADDILTSPPIRLLLFGWWCLVFRSRNSTSCYMSPVQAKFLFKNFTITLCWLLMCICHHHMALCNVTCSYGSAELCRDHCRFLVSVLCHLQGLPTVPSYRHLVTLLHRLLPKMSAEHQVCLTDVNLVILDMSSRCFVAQLVWCLGFLTSCPPGYITAR